MIGKNFVKRMRAKTNPAESPAIMDHSTHREMAATRMIAAIPE